MISRNGKTVRNGKWTLTHCIQNRMLWKDSCTEFSHTRRGNQDLWCNHTTFICCLYRLSWLLMRIYSSNHHGSKCILMFLTLSCYSCETICLPAVNELWQLITRGTHSNSLIKTLIFHRERNGLIYWEDAQIFLHWPEGISFHWVQWWRSCQQLLHSYHAF